MGEIVQDKIKFPNTISAKTTKIILLTEVLPLMITSRKKNKVEYNLTNNINKKKNSSQLKSCLVTTSLEK